MAAERGGPWGGTVGDGTAHGPGSAIDGERAASSAGGTTGAGRTAPGQEDAVSPERTGARPPGRRRGTRRRATGGSAPDSERALRPGEWDHAARQLGADAPEPGDGGGGPGHEQWLREQRPPHWG